MAFSSQIRIAGLSHLREVIQSLQPPKFINISPSDKCRIDVHAILKVLPSDIALSEL